MKLDENYYDFKAESKNQIIAAIYQLESHNIDTRQIEIEDWEDLTLRLSLGYDLSQHNPTLLKAYVMPVYKGEKSYKAFELDKVYIENCVSFQRFSDLISMTRKLN
ncbi:MAG: hypothetical protein CL760_06410 [Chloroflexi bacterium]|nr:hypothetical protein [Chloroflexota bacterium]